MFKWLRKLFGKLFKKDYEDYELPDNRDIIDDLKGLNEKYIKKFIDIHTHESVCDDYFVVLAKRATAQQYAAELALKRAQSRSKNNEEFYLAEGREEALGIYTYRRRLRKYDSPMKAVLDKRIEREASDYLAEQNKESETAPETFKEVFAELNAILLSCVCKGMRDTAIELLTELYNAHKQCKTDTFEVWFTKLESLITIGIRGKKRRAELYELIDQLAECCMREIEERKARTSDITVLRFIAEILKGKRGVPELPAPQTETSEEQVPPEYDSESSKEYFISPEVAKELEEAMQDEMYGTEPGEFFENDLEEFEDELYDKVEDELDQSEEPEAEQQEIEIPDNEQNETQIAENGDKGEEDGG